MFIAIFNRSHVADAYKSSKANAIQKDIHLKGRNEGEQENGEANADYGDKRDNFVIQLEKRQVTNKHAYIRHYDIDGQDD
jgi:hypothetical protein